MLQHKPVVQKKRWNRSGVSLLCNTALDVKGVATHVLSICACVDLCLFSSPCDLFADRPQCSPLCRGFHANAAGGKTKDEDSLGQWDRSLGLLLLLTSVYWECQTSSHHQHQTSCSRCVINELITGCYLTLFNSVLLWGGIIKVIHFWGAFSLYRTAYI